MQPEQIRAGSSAEADVPAHDPTGEGDPTSETETTGDAPAILPVESLNAWVREHQTAALIGSFAVGVFLGVLLRRS
ncbi:hypothetical protein [Rhodocaloribacter sp.]